LLVAPSGESKLVDTGYAVGDRDAKRIYAATQKAGLRKIDHLVISHFHGDHMGGLAALAKMIPIERFYDHGGTVDAVDQGRLDEYKAVAGGKRTIVKPGDEITMAGVKTLVVSANKQFLTNSVPGGGPNPLCSDAPQMSAAAGENQRMVGVLHSYGNFRFLNLIDLDWHSEMELACPINKLGTVTLYQTRASARPTRACSRSRSRAGRLRPMRGTPICGSPSCRGSRASGKDTCRSSTATRRTIRRPT
jgi:hypothetical protein